MSRVVYGLKKKILNMLFVIGLLFPIFLSASSFSMSMDCPSTVKLGDTISCTIKANIDSDISGIEGKFSLGSTAFDSFTMLMVFQ